MTLLGCVLCTSPTLSQQLFTERAVESLNPIDRSLMARSRPEDRRAVVVVPLDRGRSTSESGGYDAVLDGERLDLRPTSFTCLNTECDSYTLAGGVGAAGSFTISYERGRGTSAAIISGRATYLLTAVSETVASLQVQHPEEHAHGHLPDVCSLDGVGLDEHPDAPGLQARSTPESCVMNVLYVLTPEATNHVNARPQYPTNTQEFIQAIHGRLSTTLQNSGLGGQKTANATLLTYTTIPGVQSSAFPGINQLKASSVARSLRSQYDADILAYYPLGPLSDFSGVAGGIGGNYGDAYTLNSVANELDGYAFTVINTHEVGHVIGGSHGRAHLFNSTFSVQYNTQMRSTIPVPYTLPYYSNPNVTIYDPYIGLYNVPSGTQTRNNAFYIANEYCETAAFENAGSTTADIEVEFTDDCETTILLTPLVYPGSNGGPDGGPYTYQWQYATSPYDTRTTFSSTSTKFPFFKPHGGFTNTYYIFLTISNGQGFTYQTTDVVTFCGGYGGPYYMSEGGQPGAEASSEHPALRSAIAMQGRTATLRALVDDRADASSLPETVEWIVRSSDGVPIYRSGQVGLTADQVADLSGAAAGMAHITLADASGAPVLTTSVILN